MKKSELIERIARKQPHLQYKDVELSEDVDRTDGEKSGHRATD